VALWRDIPKIDSHVHILRHPREDTCLGVNPPERMLEVMAAERIQRVVVLPIYDPAPGSRDDSARDQNRRQVAWADQYLEQFICLAACPEDIHPVTRAEEVAHLVQTTRLAGVKLHPTTGIPADDWSLLPLYRKLADLGAPVLIHSNPSDNDPHFDDSSPARIARVMAAFPDLKAIVGHLGGWHFMECLGLEQYGHFELSGGLLRIAELMGTGFAERFLRRLGVNRLLFGTDYAAFGYEAYYRVLDAMGWTAAEQERIAYGNAAELWGLA